MKKVLNKVVANLIFGGIGACAVLGFFWLLGVIESFLESHFVIVVFLFGAIIIGIIKGIEDGDIA